MSSTIVKLIATVLFLEGALSAKMFASWHRALVGCLGLLLATITMGEDEQQSRVTMPPPSTCVEGNSCSNSTTGRRLLGDMGIADHRDILFNGGLNDPACKQSISLGGFHTCVIEMPGKAHDTGATVGAYAEGGRARCWGKNNWGQASPPNEVMGNVKWISAGYHYSCAINMTGIVNCWGRHGFNIRGGQYVPAEVEAKVALTISVGFDHTCVIFSDNTPFCWGWGSILKGSDGQGPDTNVMGCYKQAVVPYPDGTQQPLESSPRTTVKATQMIAGRHNTCLRKTDGYSMCWGRNDKGQSENPTHVNIGNLRREVGPLLSMSTHTTHTCAIRASDRRGVCWGENTNGQVAYPMSGIWLPYHAEELNVIAVGEKHSCAIRNNGLGSIICWGYNHYKQSDPVPSHAAVMIALGDHHSCSSDLQGRLKCWGWNNWGQIAVPSDLAPIMTYGCRVGGPGGGVPIDSRIGGQAARL